MDLVDFFTIFVYAYAHLTNHTHVFLLNDNGMIRVILVTVAFPMTTFILTRKIFFFLVFLQIYARESALFGKKNKKKHKQTNKISCLLILNTFCAPREHQPNCFLSNMVITS